MIPVHVLLQHEEAAGNLPFELIGNADDGAFRHIGVAGADFLNRAGGQAMAGDIDDVVGPPHHPHIALGVDHPGIAGVVRALGESFVTVEIADRVEIRVQKGAIANVLPKGSLKAA